MFPLALPWLSTGLVGLQSDRIVRN